MRYNAREQKFWTVQLLPLCSEDKSNFLMVNRLQQEICIDKKLFGLGWSDDGNTKIHFLRDIFGTFSLNYIEKKNNSISRERAESIINIANNKIAEIKKLKPEDSLKEINIKVEDEKIDVLDLYNKIYNNLYGKNDALAKSIEYYKKIKKDDLIIARLRTGKYCIGRVSNNEIHFINGSIAKKQDEILNNINSTGFSWYMNVYKWYMIDESIVPGHISGRFSSRPARRTIYPINDIHLTQLMKILYSSKENEDMSFHHPRIIMDTNPIPINETKIAEVLSPYELEDLAFLYIMNKHEKEGFQLLPSKCKLDEVRYECYLINKNYTNRVIAFQVKNREELECSEYVDSNIEKIYLYSAMGYNWNGNHITGKIDKKQDKEFIQKIIKEKWKIDNVEVISNEELFDVFKKSEYFKYQYDRGYYKFDK